MKKLIFGMIIMLFCSGCGHNVINYSEGWGVSLTWNPSNSISPKIDAGDIESFNAVIKENTEVTFEKDSGGMIIDTIYDCGYAVHELKEAFRRMYFYQRRIVVDGKKSGFYVMLDSGAV